MGKIGNLAENGRRGSELPEDLIDNLVPAQYQECRRVDGKIINIFHLACYVNQQIVNHKKVEIENLLMADVVAAIPVGRRSEIEYPSGEQKLSVEARERAHRNIQPVLMIKFGPGPQPQLMLLDGMGRVNLLLKGMATYIRCVILSYDQALHYGRRGLYVIGRKGKFIEQEGRQRTLMYSLPSSIDDKGAFSISGESARRPALSVVNSEKYFPKDDVFNNDSDDNKSKDLMVFVPPRVEHMSTSLVPLAATIASVKAGVVFAAFDAIENRIPKLDLNFDQQALLDIKIISRPSFFGKKGNAPPDLNCVILIIFLKKLFDKIKTLYPNDRRAGYSIVGQDKRYQRMIGKFSDLNEQMEKWSEIEPKKGSVYANGIRDEIVGIVQQHVRGGSKHSSLEQYYFDLIQVTLKALRVAELQNSNLRDLREYNKGHWRGSLDDIRKKLDQAVDGGLSQSPEEEWYIDYIGRINLALHARQNPAKIFREEVRYTLSYQWLVALGDIIRCGSAIISCHMAHEFVLVDRQRRLIAVFRHQNWNICDSIFDFLTTDHNRSYSIKKEVYQICIRSIQIGCAMRVKLSSEHGRASIEVDAELSPKASKLVEAVIMLT